MATTYFEPGTVAGGGAAPDDATYVTVTSNPTLSAERVLTEGDGLTVVDGTTIVTVSLNIDGISELATAIADADFIPFWDVTATASNEKITWANLKAQLTTDGFGDVVGGGGTDNHVPRFDTTAVLLQDSGVIIDDTDNMSGVTTLVVDGAGDSSFVGSVGFGIAAPLAQVHVYTGASGGTPPGSADEFSVEGSGANVGITIQGSDTAVTYLNFAGATDNTAADLRFEYASTRLTMTTGIAGGTLRFRTATGTTAMTIDASQDVFVTTGDLTISAGVLIVSGSGASTFVGAVEIGGGFGSTGATLTSAGLSSWDGDMRVDADFECNASAAASSIESNAYSITATHAGIIYIGHSLTDTIGTLTTTTDGDRLGEIRFRGVDTGSNWENAIRIVCVQDGAAGVRVPGRVELYITPDGATAGVLSHTWEVNGDYTVEIGNIAVSSGVIVCSGSGDTSFVGDVGIGLTAPDAPLHVLAGTQSTPTLDADTVACFEKQGDNCYISIISDGAVSKSGIYFGDKDNEDEAEISWASASGTVTMLVAGTLVSTFDASLVSSEVPHHIKQPSLTGAVPVLTLEQTDVSEEMIEFITTIGTGNAIEAVAAKALTTTHFIKVTIPGSLTRYFPVGTIA